MAAALCSHGCGLSPSLRCEVTIDNPAGGIAEVSCQATRGPAADVVVKTMSQDEIVRVSDFSARTVTGVPLKVTERHDVSMGPDARHYTERIVHTGGELEFIYRYRTRPGAEMGDLTGTRSRGFQFGHCDDHGALLSGRNLFLLPSWYGSLADITVVFHIPRAWRVVGTLLEREGAVRTRGMGIAAATLIDSVIGLGQFDAILSPSADPALRLFLRQDMDSDARHEIGRLGEKGLRFLATRLGPLEHDLAVVLVPPPPDGSMVLVPPSTSGMGSEMAWPGPTQSYDLFFAMARSWTAFPESPLKLLSEDAWLKEALPAYYAVGATDAVGVRTASLSWGLRARLAAQEQGILSADLPTEEASFRRARTKGGFLLALTDARLRAATAGRDGIDDVVADLRSSRGSQTFTQVLTGRASGVTGDIHRLVAESSAVPLEGLSAVKGHGPQALSLQPSGPDRARSDHLQRLRLLVTSDLHGTLEVCGCVARQLGGIARRETIRRRLLGQQDPVLMVDLGNAYTYERGDPILDAAGRRELGLALDLMGRQGYAVAAVGHTEMLRGVPFFQDMARVHSLPYVNANLSSGGRPLAPPWSITRSGSLRIGWISALDPGRFAEDHARYYEEHIQGLASADVVSALADAARAVRPKVDLVLAIGSIAPDVALRVLREAPVDGVLSSDTGAGALSGDLAFPTDDEARLIGFLDGKLLFFGTGEGRWMQEIVLSLSEGGRIARADLNHYLLDEGVPDFPAFRQRLAAFYDAARVDPDLAGSEKPVAQVLPGLLKARYVGAASCALCHAEEMEDWEDTHHAAAFTVLLTRHRNYAPRCVGCHVTGYGHPSGYRLGDPLETLRHVQCEMCHGPGSLHSAAPSTMNIIRRPPREACFECHTIEHSNMNADNFAEYYGRVIHGQASGASQMSSLGHAGHSAHRALQPHRVGE